MTGGEQMIEIRIIDSEHKEDIRILNEPFALFGKMIPSYINEKWSYDISYWEKEKITEMCFPEEDYDYETMQNDCVFVGAYEEETCIGLAILQQRFLKYMYLYDLKVNSAYRGKNVAADLIKKCKKIALQQGYRGIYTYAQDNNLGACKFYVKSGFYIGGFDSNVYKGTKQEGKSDIIFYWD